MHRDGLADAAGGTPAAAEWHLPCLLGLLGGCSTVIPLSREYAARPVQPLNPQAALEEVNAFRAKYGLNALVLDARLSRAATIQSNDQARRIRWGTTGVDGSTIMDRAERVGYRPRIVAENVAYGLKSAVGRKVRAIGRTCLIPEVTAIGIAMAKVGAAAGLWTPVLGAEIQSFMEFAPSRRTDGFNHKGASASVGLLRGGSMTHLRIGRTLLHAGVDT